MLGLVIFVCLLRGPSAKWVQRFLPSTANRIVFVLLVGVFVVASLFQGAASVAHGDRGEGYFTLTFAVLCIAALFRFVYDWWLRVRQPPIP